MLVFDESGKPDYPERKPPRAKKRTNKKFTQPMVSTPGFDRGPQFGGGELLLPLITLAPPGLGHKATKGSVEFNMSVF